MEYYILYNILYNMYIVCVRACVCVFIKDSIGPPDLSTVERLSTLQR